MGYFFEVNRQRRAQWAPVRRKGPWGIGPVPQAVLHTYEAPHTRSLLAAATYLLQRPDPGSYHTICGDDSPTDILRLAPVTGETWHCVPSNKWAIGISAICYAHEWGRMPTRARLNLVRSMAYAAHLASRELIAAGKQPIPAKWITRDEAMRGVWGFVYHRQMDPGRRSDPDNRADDFPAAEFMAEYIRLQGTSKATTAAPTPAPKEWDEMATKDEVKAAFAEVLENHRIGEGGRSLYEQNNDIRKFTAEIRSLVRQIAAREGVDIDEAAIVRGVLEGLSPESIAAAIPEGLAGKVADELGRRIGGAA